MTKQKEECYETDRRKSTRNTQWSDFLVWCRFHSMERRDRESVLWEWPAEEIGINEATRGSRQDNQGKNLRWLASNQPTTLALTSNQDTSVALIRNWATYVALISNQATSVALIRNWATSMALTSHQPISAARNY